jgi:hypothetical protein
VAQEDEAKAKAKKAEAQDDEGAKHAFDIEQKQPQQHFVISIFLFIYYNNE